MSNLKPRPFCGNEDVELIEPYYERATVVTCCVQCNTCDARAGDELSERAAIQVWNTRNEPRPIEMEVRPVTDVVSRRINKRRGLL